MSTAHTTPARKGKAATVSDILPALAVTEPPAVIDPPQSWALHAPLGFMACTEGNAGQLVRLAELLRWLEQTRSLPRAAAIDTLCDAMPPDVMGWLYRVQPGNYAQPVPPDSGFGYQTAAQIAAAAHQARHAVVSIAIRHRSPDWGGSGRSNMRIENGKITAAGPTPTEPGLPALLRCIRTVAGLAKRPKAACEPMDDARGWLALLAVPVSKAHALWGYGAVRVTEVAANEVSATTAPAEWTGGKLLAEQGVLKRAGVRNFTGVLAEQSGVSVRDIRRLIAAHKTTQSSAMGSMVTAISGRKQAAR